MAPLVSVVATVLVLVAIGTELDRLCFAAEPRTATEEWIAVLAFGLVGVGALVFVLGWAQLFYRTTFVAVGAASLLVVALDHRRIARLCRRSVAPALRVLQRAPLLVVATAVTYGYTVWFQLHAPLGSDELDYKWTTPLRYAMQHGFVAVSRRYSNGLYLAALEVVPAATFRSLHGARFVQLLPVALVGLSAAFIARRVGGSGIVALFATLGCLLMPTFTVNVGSDMLVGSLLAASFALLCARRSARHLLAAGVLLAGAVATKPIAVTTVPVLLAVALFVRIDDDAVRLVTRAELRTGLAQVGVAFVVPVVVAAGLSVTQAFLLIGRPYDDAHGLAIFRSGSARLESGRAVGRIPSLRDVVVLPAVPLWVALQSEKPYGRRVGVFLAAALPAALLGPAIADQRWRRRMLVPLTVGGAAFLVQAPVFPLTRYLLFVWVCFYCATDVMVEWVRTRVKRAAGLVVWTLTQLALVAGFFDALRYFVVLKS